jgi:hypothetical protein
VKAPRQHLNTAKDGARRAARQSGHGGDGAHRAVGWGHGAGWDTRRGMAAAARWSGVGGVQMDERPLLNIIVRKTIGIILHSVW